MRSASRPGCQNSTTLAWANVGRTSYLYPGPGGGSGDDGFFVVTIMSVSNSTSGLLAGTGTGGSTAVRLFGSAPGSATRVTLTSVPSSPVLVRISSPE